jgi:type IX secretion system PorP/SprF family membrane protein
VKLLNKIIILFVVGLIETGTSLAQDISFSQVYSSPLYLSPSFAGFTNGGRVAMTYRDQWPEISNTFRTYALSYDQYLANFNSGIGLLVVRDDQGSGQLVTQDIGLVYAYELEITRDIFVRPGLQFKYSERTIDPSLLSQVGPDGYTFPWINSEFAVESYRKIDATASLMVYSDFLWLGFTMDHLVKNDIGFTDIETTVPIKTVIYGGWKYIYQEASRSHNEQSASLAFMYQNQSGFNQLDAGIYWNTNPIEVGLWYRGLPGISSESLTTNDALIFSLGINVGTIHLAYSYDLTLSGLAGYSGGANEFSLIYRFAKKSVKSKPRGPIPCSDTSAGLNESNSRPKPRKLF